MADIIRVPSTGNSDELSVVSQVAVALGDHVVNGQVLVMLETAKAEVEIPATRDGVVLHIGVSSGDEVPPFHPAIWIGHEGEVLDQESPTPDSTTGPSAPESPQPPPVASPTARGEQAPAATHADTHADTGRIAASPRARVFAEREGIDLHAVTGSGPGGRIIMPDVLSHRAAGGETAPGGRLAPEASPADFSLVPHSRTRTITARRMHESLTNTAQLTLHRYVPGEVLASFRGRLKETLTDGALVPSVNDLIMFAVSRALPQVPAMNSHYTDEGLKVFRHVNLGFAVDTDGGLLVPVVNQANTLSVFELADATKQLGQRARDGKLGVADMTGGTFTITNLGALGVGFFTPVLNTPETGILGIGQLAPLVPGTPAVIPLSLTFDHRSLDGAEAARALDAIAVAIQHIDALTLTA